MTSSKENGLGRYVDKKPEEQEEDEATEDLKQHVEEDGIFGFMTLVSFCEDAKLIIEHALQRSSDWVCSRGKAFPKQHIICNSNILLCGYH